MATKTKSKNSDSSSSNGSSGDSAFREEQKRLAAQQNQLSENAVPEQRPIASQQSSAPENTVARRRREAGKDKPMPQSAHKKAASEAQEKKAEKESIGVPSIRPGAVIEVTDGEYEGSIAVVTRVAYKDEAEAAKAASGDPGAAAFAEVSEVFATTRGPRTDKIVVEAGEYQLLDQKDLRRTDVA